MFPFLQNPQFHKQVSEEMMQSCGLKNQEMWDMVIALLKKGMEEGTCPAGYSIRLKSASYFGRVLRLY